MYPAFLFLLSISQQHCNHTQSHQNYLHEENWTAFKKKIYRPKKFDSKSKIGFGKVENIVGKEETGGNCHFLRF